ncbi:metallophosphoesterase family protein [Xanthobacter sp. V4C-4]|uniref:metallophosphoesterase family protein n=1 Tax=Xanthobacter cornucopiae TaxID=3119924 RepID=UPI00372655A0
MNGAPVATDGPPRVAEGVRVYAVGDIHGHLDLLENLLRQMEQDQAAHPGRAHREIYLGDYVDRGPATAGVLDTLLRRQARQGAICLSGNHEELMLEAYRTYDAFIHWLRVGGRAAALSYLPRLAATADDVEDRYLWHRWRGAMPESHIDFLRGLGTTHVCGDYLFVHAGLRPGVPVEAQTRHDCLWIRHAFLDHGEPFEHVVVHGHTPVAEPEVRSNRIGIDTGAFASGRLTCLVLDGAERAILST